MVFLKNFVTIITKKVFRILGNGIKNMTHDVGNKIRVESLDEVEICLCQRCKLNVLLVDF